ncbi:MAG TPA: hypothetical protein VMZ11_00205 [Mycobacteriales bacterium]|nr:hypothetical protein [Mycobacteriales bacterium]
MRRPLAVLVLTVAALAGLAVPAQAAFQPPPVPGPDCLPVPDLDGHVWYLCNWKP